MNAIEALMRKILSEKEAHSADDFRIADRKMGYFPAWVRILSQFDACFAASRCDPFQERVSGGPLPTPQAQQILEAKERHSEYQRVLRNVEAIKVGLTNLPQDDLDFAVCYWIDLENMPGDSLQNAADALGIVRSTAAERKKRCLGRMIPYLEEADTILIRAWFVEEISLETVKSDLKSGLKTG
jgi:hypothetical protein